MKKVNTVRVKLLPSQSCGIGETVAGALTQQPKAVEEVTPRRARLSDIEMLQMSAWLDAGDAGRIGEESLADALARLSSLALEGNEDATKMLIVAGNSIASSLSILWIGPGNAQRRPLLRALAAKERRFPVSYHSIEENNIGWKKMVTDLGVGSDGPERTDGNQRTLPDVVDFLIKASIQTHEWFRNTSNPAMVPAKYSTF
ncbi:MAG: hypothetical protein NTX09_19210, partial [Verrucomicrobia bacterium]|nr:hypothetical protein [Verrucomicrobiota bacterium]